VAADIGEAVRDKLAGIQERLKQAGADIGWVAPVNIHLTILFLGAVFESQASELAAAADGIAAAYRPCALEVKGLGYFGRTQSPRTIWAGLTGNLQPLLALQNEIAEAAKQTGIYTDAKPFNPHLTIGRVRSSRRVQNLIKAMEPYKDLPFGTLEIQNVRLVKSALAPQGPSYTLLHESRLAAD